MSTDCHGYGVYEAAAELLFCERHRQDERVLLVSGPGVDRDEHTEVETLKRFVQGVKENPHSSHWHALTGYVTEIVDGRSTRTGRRSLPL